MVAEGFQLCQYDRFFYKINSSLKIIMSILLQLTKVFIMKLSLNLSFEAF